MKTKLKKLTALLLSVLMIMTAVPFAVSAEDALAASGKCGDNVSWSFESETGVLTISGNGEMYNYSSQESPFYENSDIRQIVIGENVSLIGAYAFENCLSVRTVRINSLSAVVGELAFEGCNDLSDFYFIGDSDEWDTFCNNMEPGNNWLMDKSVHCLSGDFAEDTYGPLSYGIINGKAMIIYCDMSFSGVLDIPEKLDGYPVEEITDNLFYGCEYITEINIPSTVKTIGSFAFAECRQLKSVSLGEGVTEIENNAFDSCSALETVSFPAALSSLGDYVFKNCNSIKNISVSSDNQCFATDSNGALYTKDYGELIRYPAGNSGTEYTVNSNTKNIREYAFYGCNNLQSVVLPDALEKIGDYAFADTALKTVRIPDKITVCDNAFSNTNTDEFHIGKGVLQSNNFSSFITAKFTVSEDNPYFSADEQGVLYNKDKTVLIRFPVRSNITEYEIPDSVKEIGTKAFNAANKLAVVIIPKSVEKIGSNAFSSMKLSFIGYMGTQDEWNAVDKKISTSISVFTDYGNCSGSCGENLSWRYDEAADVLIIDGSGEMESNASFNDYGWYSFKDKMKFVEIADDVTSVGANAFAGCTELGEAYLGSGIKSIGENAFAGCTGLANVTLMSDSFTADNAFSGNNANLTFIVKKSNSAAADFAAKQGAKLITVEYSELDDDNNVISFGGETVVYDDWSYYYTDILTVVYPSANYVHFDRLVFDGKNAADFNITLDELDKESAELAFKGLYVRIGEDGFSFDNVLKLLKEGNTDAFRLEQHKSAIAQFFSDIAQGIEKVVIGLLKLLSNAVRYITNLFKKK